ncbi:MAG: hypothetical protein B6D55_04840 [Candidatus Omnitrophica bacterium 4484_70.2]|nr:MAG: hypothetical protein B6D55_04840 [Candidatus Omnitrophica bacterium 4484_70.2]
MRKKIENRIFKIFLLILLSVILPLFSSSPFVPLDHWAYKYIDKLAIYGLIDSQKLGAKPYTYEDVKKWTEMAIEKIQNDEVNVNVGAKDVENILLRLRREFIENEKRYTYGIKGGIEYSTQEFEPLNLGNSRGIDLYKKENFKFSPFIIGNLNSKISGSLKPLIYYQNSNFKMKMEEIYLNYEWKNLRISAGRIPVKWGPGYHGQLLFSDNSFPMYMFMIQNKNSFHYPWIFKKLGPSYITYFISRLDRNNRKYPYPFLTGLRFEINPFPYLSIGLNNKTICAGEGRRSDLEPQNYLRILLGRPSDVWSGVGKYKSNGQLSWDFRLNILNLEKYAPFLGERMQVYGEFGREYSPHNPLGVINSFHGYLLGTFIPNIFNIETLDFRLEYADTNYNEKVNWYRHSVYPSYYEGHIIGHHIGNASSDIYLELSKQLSENWDISIYFDKEKRNELKKFVENRKIYGIRINFLPFDKNIEWNFDVKYVNMNNIKNKSGIDDTFFVMSANFEFKF